ncbi:VOC family protein [Aquihabitans sp. McL0605]|uniref:VOC family protein n=1 Tax=Aquihabitans sp. McL0605 TaxID=3415671 RepID=UPI003CF00542
MAVNPIPDNYPRLAPYVAVKGADDAIAFYRDVFGFEQRGDVMRSPDGRVGHAELLLGDSVLMLADEWPEVGNLGPLTVGGSPVQLSIYVDDVDAVYDKAIAGGATSVRAPEDQFYGDRMAGVIDPFGHRWSLGSHIEDVDDDEMARRAQEMMGG